MSSQGITQFISWWLCRQADENTVHQKLYNFANSPVLRFFALWHSSNHRGALILCLQKFAILGGVLFWGWCPQLSPQGHIAHHAFHSNCGTPGGQAWRSDITSNRLSRFYSKLWYPLGTKWRLRTLCPTVPSINVNQLRHFPEARCSINQWPSHYRQSQKKRVNLEMAPILLKLLFNKNTQSA